MQSLKSHLGMVLGTLEQGLGQRDTEVPPTIMPDRNNSA